MININPMTRQSGAVLVIALIFLVMLTLLGITGAQNTIMEERMTGNYRDTQIAHEAADAALQRAMKVLEYPSFESLAWDGTDGTYDVTESVSKDPFSASVSSYTVDDVSGIHDVVYTDPTYYIEKLPPVRMPGSSVAIGTNPKVTITLYRVTAKGWGKASTTDPQVILQGTFLQW